MCMAIMVFFVVMPFFCKSISFILYATTEGNSTFKRLTGIQNRGQLCFATYNPLWKRGFTCRNLSSSSCVRLSNATVTIRKVSCLAFILQLCQLF